MGTAYGSGYLFFAIFFITFSEVTFNKTTKGGIF